MTRWTPEQKKAIEARDTNLLVSAGAGAGKTAVLVERIIRLLINDKADIDRILIVTFTHAAAGEMRERISAALLQALEADSAAEETRLHLSRQLQLLPHASISTIHAFCTDIVRRYFYLLDIDPDFRIANETESLLQKWDAIEEIFEKEYELGDPLFLDLIEMFGKSRDDVPVQELVLSLYDFVQSKPYPQKWLQEKIDDFTVNETELQQSIWVQTLVRQLNFELTGAIEFFREALSIADYPSGPQEYAKTIQQDIKMVQELIQLLPQGADDFGSLAAGVGFARLSRVSKEVSPELKEMAQELRNTGKKIVEGVIDKLLRRTLADYQADLQELYPRMKYLGSLLESFSRLYQAKKLEKGILDFNDLEHYALEILKDNLVAREFQDKYSYIFVDEYQDSNEVQETILNLIKRERNLFYVGDVKQSIYRFRLADPTLFIAKYRFFKQSATEGMLCIDLSRNFRSRTEIITAVNYIFKNLMTRELGEIDYDEKAFLYPGKAADPLNEPATELCLLDKKSVGCKSETEATDDNSSAFSSDTLTVLEEISQAEAEARVAVQKIQGLLGQSFYDEKVSAERNFDYRDIVILMRSTANQASVFLETLLAAGIPAYADVNTGYFEALEVNVFINLLRIIDNKRQDIPLLSVMRSFIGGFSADDLIEIRMQSRTTTFCTALEEYMQNHNDELQRKVEHFWHRLDSWQEKSRYMPVDEFIWMLLMDTGYYYYVGAMPGGISRQANLRILLDRAKQYVDTSLKGLFNFLKFIDKLKSSSGDMGVAKILSEKDNVVRIMSIHKSKGLEFPAVILAGLGKQFNMRDANNNLLMHKDLGLGPRYVNLELRGFRDTLPRIVIQNQIKMESLAEEMRILYVACTRPQERLIMIGSLTDLTKSAVKWSRNLTAFNLSRCKNYLDWIGPILMRHHDGQKLRNFAQFYSQQLQCQADESKWKLDIINIQTIIQAEKRQAEKQNLLKNQLLNFKLEKEAPEQIRIVNRLNWHYGYREAEKVPAKLSVTQVKELNADNIATLFLDETSTIEKPVFLQQERPLSAAEKGTIMHLIMKCLNFERVGTQEEIAEQIQEMVRRELLTEAESQAIDSSLITRFFSSSLGKRVLKSNRIFRETPFNLVCPADKVIAGLMNCHENMLIQGVIDLYFYESEGIILVDYKTDYITGNKRQELLQRYGRQIELYKTALEQIQGVTVKESYFYLFSTGEAIKV